MTAKKSLKKRVRARQKETGERYSDALRHVKAASPHVHKPEVVEMPNVSEDAKAAGLSAKAFVSSALWAVRTGDTERHVLVRRIFETLVEVLRVTAADVTTSLLRRALLGGEPLPPLSPQDVLGRLEHRKSFQERLRLGVRGVSHDGRSISFEVAESSGGRPLLLVATLWPVASSMPVLYVGLGSEWMAAAKPLRESLKTMFQGFIP